MFIKQNKIMLILYSILLFGSLRAEMGDEQWKILGTYIATNGEQGNDKDFEAAKQALLNIRDAGLARSAAAAIMRKWPNKVGADRTAWFNSLVRYPNMDKNQVKAAGRKLFNDKKNFINDTLKIDFQEK